MFCIQSCRYANITIKANSVSSIVLSGESSGSDASIFCGQGSICSIECLGQNACDGMAFYCIGAQCEVECSMDTECPLMTSSQPTSAPTFTPTDATSDEETTPIAKGEDILDLMVVMSVGAILFVCSLCVLYYTMRRQKSHRKLSEIEGIVGAMAIENNAEIDSGKKKKEESSEREAVNVELLAMMEGRGDSLHNLENDNVNANGTENGLTNDSKPVRDGEGFNGYEQIEEILKSIYDGDCEQQLMNFKNEMIDDDILFGDDKFRAKYPRDHEFWTELIPQRGARFTFFERIYGNV